MVLNSKLETSNIQHKDYEKFRIRTSYYSLVDGGASVGVVQVPVKFDRTIMVSHTANQTEIQLQRCCWIIFAVDR